MVSSETQVIGSFDHNGKTKYLCVTQNNDGTWTAGGPWEMKDFAKRGFAVRWLKRIYADPGVKVEWLE